MFVTQYFTGRVKRLVEKYDDSAEMHVVSFIRPLLKWNDFD